MTNCFWGALQVVHWDVSPHEAENLRPLRKSTPYRTSLIFSCLETLSIPNPHLCTLEA